jgi:hypothetical protein
MVLMFVCGCCCDHSIRFVSQSRGIHFTHDTINTHLQVICIHLLHHNARRSTASIADSSAAILALLQLMQQGDDDPGSRAT